MKEKCYHVEDFAGLYPVWPIIEFSMAPTGTSKDERMNSFSKCIVGLLEEILHVDDMAMIAPLTITDNNLGKLHLLQGQLTHQLHKTRQVHHDQRW